MSTLCLPKRWNTGAVLALSMTVSARGTAAVNNPYASRAVPTPVLVSGSRQYARVSAGFFHSCVVTTSGEGWCWGSNEYLQLGGTSIPAAVTAAVSRPTDR